MVAVRYLTPIFMMFRIHLYSKSKKVLTKIQILSGLLVEAIPQYLISEQSVLWKLYVLVV